MYDADHPAIPAPVVQNRVIAVGRYVRTEAAPAIGAALVEGGVCAIEMTLNEPQDEALRAIRALRYGPPR